MKRIFGTLVAVVIFCMAGSAFAQERPVTTITGTTEENFRAQYASCSIAYNIQGALQANCSDQIVIAEDIRILTDDANACFSGGSLADQCDVTDADRDGTVSQQDKDYMWNCGWYIVRGQVGLLTKIEATGKDATGCYEFPKPPPPPPVVPKVKVIT